MCGLPVKDFISFEECVACARGKHHRKPHLPKAVNLINKVLQLLHMDLFGSVNILSINKNSYCLVMIDDYSRFTWFFFLSNKSGIVDLIKKCVVMIKNQTNEKVKALRTDNGMEFKNAVLDHFCAEKGIMRQYSAIRTPQQNGVAERRNHNVSGSCSDSPTQRINPDAEATLLTPAEREFMTRDTSAATQTFRELFFPEPIANEYVASSSHGSRSSEADESAEDGFININNLPVTLNDISHEIHTRLQSAHSIENIEPKNVEMELNEPSWVDAMHKELNQFEKLGVWKLVKLPKGKKFLDTC
ncbi:hypothetical protein Lser_V15G18147 [Lactuca serriola]